MAIDRADWHYGGDEYPKDLPCENAGTHIGIFLAWAISRGLEGDLHKTESEEALDDVRQRRMTGRGFLFGFCDEKFWSDDLSEDGYAFARDYYESSRYFSDYEATLVNDLPTFYHVADTWENYDAMAVVLDHRYAEWQTKRAKQWWKFWK